MISSERKRQERKRNCKGIGRKRVNSFVLNQFVVYPRVPRDLLDEQENLDCQGFRYLTFDWVLCESERDCLLKFFLSVLILSGYIWNKWREWFIRQTRTDGNLSSATPMSSLPKLRGTKTLTWALGLLRPVRCGTYQCPFQQKLTLYLKLRKASTKNKETKKRYAFKKK